MGNVSLLTGTREKLRIEQVGGKIWRTRNSHGRLSTPGAGRTSYLLPPKSTDSGLSKFLGHHRMDSAIVKDPQALNKPRGERNQNQGASSS